jgi:RNA polymerase sigma-70 factor (ECF subfamily)
MNVDPEVIARAIAGDEQAFAEIVGAFRRPVLSHIRHMLRDSDAAEDVWQDVQFRVWRNLHRFDQARKFSTWIFTIATNTALNEIRRSNRHKSVISLEEVSDLLGGDDYIPGLEDQHGRPDDELEDRELNARLSAAVHALPEIHRRTLVMREIDGQSYQEIAAATDTPMGTVKSRLARARQAVASRVA